MPYLTLLSTLDNQLFFSIAYEAHRAWVSVPLLQLLSTR